MLRCTVFFIVKAGEAVAFWLTDLNLVIWSQCDDCNSSFFSVCLVQTCLCRSPDVNSGSQLHVSFVARRFWSFCWWQCNNLFCCERIGWEWLLGKGWILDTLLRTCSLWVFQTQDSRIKIQNCLIQNCKKYSSYFYNNCDTIDINCCTHKGGTQIAWLIECKGDVLV